MKQLSTIGLEQVILTLFKRASDNKIRASLSTIANIVNSDKDKVRYAIDNLIEDNKVHKYEDTQSTYYSVVNDIEVDMLLHELSPKLFNSNLTPKHYAVIKVLQRYCISENNAHKSDFIISQCQFIDAIKINDSVELRGIMGDLIESNTYYKYIGSSPLGYWIPLSSDKDHNSNRNNRLYTAIVRTIKNGTAPSLIYSMINEAKQSYQDVLENQQRHQFNSEKTNITHYGDDL